MASHDALSGTHALAECHGDPLENLDRSLWQLFSQAALKYPEHEAIVSLWQRHTEYPDQVVEDAAGSPDAASRPLRWTYQSLLDQSNRLAAWLRRRGCTSGMCLVGVFWNSIEWALFFWAAAKLEMTFVPVDPRLVATDADFFLGATAPAVLVVQDSEAEDALEKGASAILEKIPLRISCAAHPRRGWIPLPRSAMDMSFYPSPPQDDAVERTDSCDVARVTPNGSNSEKISLIVFTSGTTSKPKGCLHSARNLQAQAHNYDHDSGRFERWLVHTPVSHIFAVNNSLRAWQNGDTVVFASSSFDVEATVCALVQEQCTFMSAIPALVKAILGHPKFPGKDALKLSYVTLGSTLISESDIKLCQESLGSGHAIQAFGMSEGAPVVSWTRVDPLLVNGYHPGVGRVLPGAAMRICAPGERQPLERNQLGELHIGGSAVISGYLNGVDSESFYHDHVGNWLATGDQALIDQDGVLHILGRYKDIIIRAGENIAPSKIEATLAEIPGLVAQVVGVPDDIAGQVPVAVVKLPDGCSKSDVLSKARSLGPMYALDRIFTLEDIGLSEFPLTITGKVRKEALRSQILKLDQPSGLPSPSPSHQTSDCHVQTGGASSCISASEVPMLPATGALNFTQDLLEIWEDLVGLQPSLDDPIYTFADSVTLLRYCDRVLNTVGQRVYLQDFADCPTVQDLAVLVNSRAASAEAAVIPGFLVAHRASATSNHVLRLNPTASEPYLHLGSSGGPLPAPETRTLDGERLGSTTEFAELPMIGDATAAALRDIGLGPGYAEDVLPIKDYFSHIIARQRPRSYVHRTCLAVKGITDSAKIRIALEVALSSRPVLRTVLADLADGTLFHVVCKPEKRLFDRIIEERTVPSDQNVVEYMAQDSIHFPRLMVQAQIARLQRTGEIHLILTYNHSVFDMLSIVPFHSDLDRLVRSPDPTTTPMASLTPFKLFADLYHSYRDSLPAQASVNYNVHRLRGISKFTDALWPIQHAPGWMIGSDRGSLHEAERAAVRNELWANAGLTWDNATARTWQLPRLSRIVNVPDMSFIRTTLKIQPQTVVKAALTAFNAKQTGQPFAIFNTILAARSWPFVPHWMESMLPHAMTIDGPTVEWVLNMIRIGLHPTGGTAKQETVQEFVHRIQEEEADLEKHAHAPWQKVLAGLGDEEAAVVVDAASRQTFVWDATMRLSGHGMGDFKVFKFEGRYDWADCGLYWNCCMLDNDNLMVIASWDTAQMTSVEVDASLDGFTDCIRRISDLKNWDTRLVDVFAP